MRSINRYFNGAKTGFTGFRFHCAHHSQSNITTTGPYNPSPRPQEQTEKKHSDQQTRQVVQLFRGAVTVRKERGHSASFLLLIVSTEERSNRQEEEKCQIKSSGRGELALF